MKKILNILVLATAIMVVHACGPESEKNAEAETPQDIKGVAMTTAEKNTFFEKERAERAENRKIEQQRLSALTPTYKDADGKIVYYLAEVDPAFKGGEKSMRAFIKENVRYPEDAAAKGYEGTVFVDFVVGKNGIVRAVEISDFDNDNVDQSLRNEAIRVVNSMPAWAPGTQHGDLVNVRYSIPITFRVDEM